MGRRIGIGGCHAGVGATTTAVNLAVLLARSGKETLYVDLSQDQDAARLLNGSPRGSSGGDPGGKLQSLRDHLFLAASQTPEEVTAHLAALDTAWDFALIDLPPLGLETRALLSVLDSLILVIPAQDLSLPSVASYCDQILEIKGSSNPDLEIEGVLITLSDKRLEDFERAMMAIANAFPADVFDFCIPRDPSQRDTERLNKPIVESFPGSRATRGYVELAMEILSDG